MHPSRGEFHLVERARLAAHAHAIDCLRDLLSRIEDADVIDLLEIVRWRDAQRSRRAAESEPTALRGRQSATRDTRRLCDQACGDQTKIDYIPPRRLILPMPREQIQLSYVTRLDIADLSQRLCTLYTRPDSAVRIGMTLLGVAQAISCDFHRRSVLKLLRIHQDEPDAARLLAAVYPRVIRRLLHYDVASLEVHFAVVEQHVDLAGDDDRVVERARAMDHRMARRQAFRRRIGGLGDCDHGVLVHAP